MTKPKIYAILPVVALLLFAATWTSYGAQEWQFHTVDKGDTLYSLAKTCGATVEELMALNQLSDSNLQIGQILKIPEIAQDKEAKEISVPVVALGLSFPAKSQEQLLGPQDKPSVSKEVLKLTSEERELLARLVYAESRGEPFEGQMAVAAVVLNRVRHPSFPNSVREVIYEPGQFLCVENGMIKMAPNESSRQAVDKALQGQDPSGGALFFYNPQKSKALAWWRTRTTTAVIGDHNFAI